MISPAAAPSNRRAELIHTLPVGLLVVESVALAWVTNGSIDAPDWLPYAIAASLVLAIALAAGLGAVPGRLAIAGCSCLLLLAAWQALSLSWSPLPELARNDALLTVFYLVTAFLAATTLRTGSERLAAAGFVALACGGLAVAAAIRIRTGNDPAFLYPKDRLAFPIDYENAQAAAFLVGFWPAIVVAARRALPVAVRGIALGCGTACAAGWLLTQSKGGAIGLAASLLVVLAVAPERLRLVPPLALALAPALAAYGPLTAPYDKSASPGFLPSIHHAGTIALVVTAVAVALGLVYGFADRLVEVGGGARRALGVVALAAVILGVVGGVAGFLVVERHPVGFVEARWRSFKHLPSQETATSHFLSIGSNRYDFWRVALDEFAKHPLAGVGDRGFQAVYLEKRRSAETPARSHSIETDVLSETGLVGFLLWLGAVGALLAGAWRGVRRADIGATAALGTGVYFLVHASVDWIWSFPAVAVPVFLLLGSAAGRERIEPLRPRVALPIAFVAFVFAALALAPPWLSSRLTSTGTTNGSTSDLRLAKRLDPLAVEPYLGEAALAPTPRGALAPLRKAVAKEPRSVGLVYELAVTELRAGLRTSAKRDLLAARRLDPGDFLIAKALAELKRRR